MKELENRMVIDREWPQASEPEPMIDAFCETCGARIAVGDYFFEINGWFYHDECFIDEFRKEMAEK